MKITKSELKSIIREALREEISKKPLKESSKGYIVYVLTTFKRYGNKKIVYRDFNEAVADAEGKLAACANMIDTMYLNSDGTLTEVPESDPKYHRWTEEEGIKA